MKRLRFLWLAAAVALCPAPAFAQDDEAPCGRDVNGNPIPWNQCVRQDPSANLEATCLTTARLDICLGYHKNNCEYRGFALACKFYNMGANCYGGDQNMCNYYMSLLRANTQCNVNGDQAACNWLQQQNF